MHRIIVTMHFRLKLVDNIPAKLDAFIKRKGIEKNSAR